MKAEERQQVAQAFGVGPEFVELLPELLADIQVLGSWPDRIVELLRESTSLGAGARALDLGCGKGAVAVPLARELGLRVDGIDLFEPFLEEARAQAEAGGVADLCRFENGDLREKVRRARGYDVVVLAGVGAGLFGDYAGCVGVLRRAVRSEGFVVIDDGFLTRPGGESPPGYEYYCGHSETVRELTAHGDALIREILIARAELAEVDRRNTERIRARIEALSPAHPELASGLAAYLRSELAECEFLETRSRAAVWLLQRRDGGG